MRAKIIDTKVNISGGLPLHPDASLHRKASYPKKYARRWAAYFSFV
jgi:hypothetical protein